MKILLSAYSCAPDAGSEPSCGWNWAVELAKAGNEIWCFTAQNNKARILNKLGKEPIENLHFIFIELPVWLEQAKSKLTFPMAYMHYLVWQYYAYKVAKTKHEDVSFDIVHHVTLGSLQLGSYMWKLPIPFVFGPIGGGEKIPNSLVKYSLTGAFRETFRKLIGFIIMNLFHSVKATSNASLVLTTSCDTADVIKRLEAKNVKLFLDCGISSGFMPEVLPPREDSDVIKVLWVGKLLPQKGLGLVLDVFSALKKPHNIKLTVVGEGPLGDHYKKFVKKNKLEDVVTFIGTLSYAELRNYYLSYDILMFCPLRNAFGIQLLEAMACGLPVITLDQHGAGTLIPDGVCIKVDPHQERLVERLRDAVVKLAESKASRERFSKNGYEYAKENLWYKKAKKMMTEYEMLSKLENETRRKLRVY